LKQLEVSGRIEQSQKQADAKTYQADRKSKTKETEIAATLQNSNLQKVADFEHEKEMAKNEKKE